MEYRTADSNNVESPLETTPIETEFNSAESGDHQHDPLSVTAQQTPPTVSPVTPHRTAGGETGVLLHVIECIMVSSMCMHTHMYMRACTRLIIIVSIYSPQTRTCKC